VRPVLCRWFEPGGTACNELRAKAGLPAPGRGFSIARSTAKP
jgi:hypothetical protein